MDECKPLVRGGQRRMRPAHRVYQHRGRAHVRRLPRGVQGRGLHSSMYRLIISAFCGIRWVVHGDLLTKTAQIEL